jgi:hypothetical protein
LDTSGQVRVDKRQPRRRHPPTDFGTPCAEKDHRAVVRHFVELIDEDCAHLPQPVHDIPVVDDLMADVDRCSEPLERELDDLMRGRPPRKSRAEPR